MLTPFGKELRKIRLDLEVNLKNMADQLSVSSAFLSGVEHGKKIPGDFVSKLANTFSFSKDIQEQLESLAAQQNQEVRIDLEGLDKEASQLATAFARKIAHLTNDEKERLKNIFMK